MPTVAFLNFESIDAIADSSDFSFWVVCILGKMEHKIAVLK